MTLSDDAPKDAREIIDAVQDVWRKYPHQRINHMWLSIQTKLNPILEHHGGNDYELAHLSKLKLEREKKLPTVLQVSRNAIDLVEENYDPEYMASEEGIAKMNELDALYDNTEVGDLPYAISEEELASLVEQEAEE
jgi:hypothetical protein